MPWRRAPPALSPLTHGVISNHPSGDLRKFGTWMAHTGMDIREWINARRSCDRAECILRSDAAAGASCNDGVSPGKVVIRDERVTQVLALILRRIVNIEHATAIRTVLAPDICLRPIAVPEVLLLAITS